MDEDLIQNQYYNIQLWLYVVSCNSNNQYQLLQT